MTRALIRQIQVQLAESAARLAIVDSGPEPREARLLWHHLCRRRTLLAALADDAEHLVLAHAESGDTAAAAGVGELAEHYRHLYGLACRALALHLPEQVRAVRQATRGRAAPHTPPSPRP
ncbi:hypothetical protein [Streptomyces sp. NBC_01304]|uniref:hypothetical protein n=1 Tax=Streptomyces sp. NBC_01304 TaxID=2903818 RepID=UPI002E124B6B|nr:hypothetical protein OG430_48925 [Streptomyces sp. NBC_01304]